MIVSMHYLQQSDHKWNPFHVEQSLWFASVVYHSMLHTKHNNNHEHANVINYLCRRKTSSMCTSLRLMLWQHAFNKTNNCQYYLHVVGTHMHTSHVLVYTA